MRELLPKGPQDRTSTDDQRRATWHSNSVWFHGSWFRTGVVGSRYFPWWNINPNNMFLIDQRIISVCDPVGRTFESIDMLITRKFIARNARRYAVHWTAVILKDWKAYHMMSLYESMNQKDYNIIPECVWMDVYGCVRMCKSKKIHLHMCKPKKSTYTCVKMCKNV